MPCHLIQCETRMHAELATPPALSRPARPLPQTAKNTAKHRSGGVGSVVANHRSGGESSMVVTTLARRALVCRRPHNFTQYRASMLNVWSHSAHTGLVDVQLNATMRLIFGTLCPISLPWLPVLTNIEPPPLRRKAASAKLVERAVAHDSWAIHRDILHPPAQWLPSRSQPWEDSKQTSQESGRKTGIQPRWSTPT